MHQTMEEAEGGPTAIGVPVGEPVVIVLERAGDGTWIATPEYGDDHYHAPSSCALGVPVPDDDDDDELVDSVTWSKAHCIKMARWALACSISDFKNDITEFIEDHFISGGVDRPVQVERVKALFDDDDGQQAGGDERAHQMLLLLRDALDRRGDDEPPALAAQGDAALLRDKGGDESESGSGHDAAAADAEAVFKEKPVSAAGFVDRLRMRMCIKVFFDPDIGVHDESSDTPFARHLWANFMSATGFVDRLWDVRRIVDVFFQHGLDEETRRATILKMLRDVEGLLKDRASAVATGRFDLF